MEILAHSYLERSQFEKAEEVLEKIRLLPGLKYDTRGLQRAIRQRVPAEEGGFNKGAALRLALIGMIVLLSVYQSWAFISWSGIQRSYNLAYGLAPETLDEKELLESLGEAERDSLVVLAGSQEARFRNLVSRYDRYIQEFPVSFFAPVAISFKDWAQKSADSIAGVRSRRKQALLNRAREVFERDGDIEEMKKILAPLLGLGDVDPFLALAERLRAEAVSRHAERPSAADLYASAIRFEAEKNYPEASKRYGALLKFYPRSSWAGKIKIPILVDSVPAGAEVFEAETLLGTTPFPVHLTSGEATLLEARRPGFLPARGEWISADRFSKNDWSSLVFLLARAPADEDRVFAVKERGVASPPVFVDDYIFWGDNRGWINWGSLASGEQSHLTVSDHEITLLGQPTVTASAVYWSHGTIVRYLPLQGPSAEWSVKEFNAGRIITTDLMAVNQLVLFGSDGKLKVVDGNGISAVYKSAHDLKPRALAPHSVAGQILVGSEDGFVHAIEVGEKFRKVWGGGQKVCVNSIRQLAASGDVVVASDGAKIVFLDSRDGSPLGKPLSAGHRHCIHADAGRFFRTSTSRGFEVFDIATQEEAPVPPLLREIVRQNTVIRLSAFADALAVVLDGGPAAKSEEERRVLICEPRTLKPLIVARCATPVSHVVGTERHIAIVESQRITVFRR